MNILVTGAAGYLGSVLVPMLLNEGFQVTVVDMFLHGVPSLASVCHDKNLTIIKADARDIDKFDKFFAVRTFDVVIPLAAVVGQAACENREFEALTTNVDAIKRLLLMLSPNQMLIYPCTNSGYGMSGEDLCTEESPLTPTSLYGRTKVDGEKVALWHGNTISLRFATLFGASPRMRLDLLVNDFVYRAVQGIPVDLFEGHFRRNFLHVRDAARAIIWAVTNIEHWTGVFNVGDDRANMTKAQLCTSILQHCPGFKWQESAIGSDPDQRDYVVSNAKIMDAGWAPTHTIDDGIVELLKTFRMPFSKGTRNY